MAMEGNMSTIDQQFVEYIVKSLVGHPDDVQVERIIDEKGVLLSLTVHPDDLGRVIGKRGVTAQSLRTLLRALGTKNDARYNLKIVNNDDERSNYSPSDDNSAPRDDNSSDNNDENSDDFASDSVSEDTTDTSSVESVDNDSDYTKKSRKELAELDDLDI